MLGLGVALLTAGAATEAIASPAWVEPVTMSGHAGNEAARIAVNDRGDAIAVWQTQDLDVPDAPYAIQAAFRPASQGWGTPVTLSDPATSAMAPSVGLDGGGNAVAVWSSDGGDGQPAAVAATRAAGEHSQDPNDGWSAPATLSSGGGNATPELAVNSAGDTVVAWAHWNSGGQVLQAATRRPGEAWRSYTDVSKSTFAGPARVGIDSNGTAVAAWIGVHGDELVNRVRTADLPAGAGAWSEPATLSGNDPHEDVTGLRLSVSESGAATTAWEQEVGSGTERTVEAAFRPAGGSIWQLDHLSGAGPAPRLPDVAVNSQGRAIAAWWELAGNDWVVRSAERPPGMSWQLPGTRLFEPDERICYRGWKTTSPLIVGPRVAIDPQGNAVAAWARCYFDGPLQSIEAAAGSADGQWDPPQDFTTAGYFSDPQVSVDGAGDALLAWQGIVYPGNVIQARGYDAAGPRLDGLSMPSAGKVGEPLGFAASPLDVWSTVAEVDWEFGDGASATGTEVSHTYDEPGDRVVRVTATDDLGNSTTESRTVAIAAVQSPPPAPSPAEPPASQPFVSRPGSIGTEPSGESGGANGAPSTQVTVARATITARAIAPLQLTCEPDPAPRCSGRVVLRSARPLKIGRSGRRHKVVLGRGRFSIAAGERRTIRVRLSRAARRLLARKRRIRARVILAGSGSANETTAATVTLVMRRRS